MRVRFRRPTAAWLAAVGICLSVVVPGQAANAQTQAPAATAPGSGGAVSDGDRPLRQVTLTDKMIEGVLASQKAFDALAETLPDAAPDNPDPKVAAQFEAIARKYGFAGYDDYNDVVDTISLVLGGFDPATKRYVGADNVIRGQIAAVEADKSIPDEDRKQALEQLNDALKAPMPPIENRTNIELVAKYYDRLSATLQPSE
ncbi:MAG: hypothetical protein M9932_19630 [Xanthobacteraceae bacterium]|nr:hypothetical protein [Xanthobacteraceae bacterium]